MLDIGPFQPQDWEVLLGLANQAVPFAPRENEEWLAYRRAFDETSRVRRHYLAWHDGQAAGYGGLEQQGEDLSALRVYVVAGAEHLRGKVGRGLYARLLAEARALGAGRLWARELAADETIRDFFTGQGFVEAQRATPANFAPVVVYQLDLD